MVGGKPCRTFRRAEPAHHTLGRQLRSLLNVPAQHRGHDIHHPEFLRANDRTGVAAHAADRFRVNPQEGLCPGRQAVQIVGCFSGGIIGQIENRHRLLNQRHAGQTRPYLKIVSGQSALVLPFLPIPTLLPIKSCPVLMFGSNVQKHPTTRYAREIALKPR